MELITSLIAIAAGLTVIVGGFKTLPAIWNAIKNIGLFMAGLEQIHDLPSMISAHQDLPALIEHIAEKVDASSQELRDHMTEEERVRAEEKDLIKELVDSIHNLAITTDKQVINIAESVFKQVAYADPVAYFIIDWNSEEDRWEWKWGNKSYFDLTGLTITQAKSGQYWDIVSPSERDRVESAADYAGSKGISLEVDFTSINLFSKKETLVRLLAAPLKQSEASALVPRTTISYLGSIHELTEQSVI